MEAIEIQNITKIYTDEPVLNQVSLHFEKGKIYGLLGRNGAGKSTLLKIIANRIFASAGEVLIHGEKASENDKIQKQIYMMSEENLYPKTMKIKKVFYWTNHFYEDFDIEKAHVLAAKFGLPLNKKVGDLSTGYQSIFKLIIALSVRVPFVLLDEPVLGLDANHRDLFYRLLLEDYEEQQKTYIIATHLIEEIASLIEHIVVIHDGRLLLNSAVEELMMQGYSVSGASDAVDAYCQGRHVIGMDSLGRFKTAYIMGERANDADTALDFSSLNLQKLFVELTKKEVEL